MNLFLEGVLLSFAFAMPIGAQNIFIIQNAATTRLSQAYIIAAFVSLLDVSLALACYFGAGLFLQTLPFVKPWLLVGGAFYLFWLAYNLWFSTATPTQSDDKQVPLLTVFRSAFVLTWLNPHALADGSIILGGYSSKMSGLSPELFLIGLCLGSPIWFFSVTTISNLAGKYITTNRFKIFNRCAGVVLAVLGIGLLSALDKG